MHNSSRYVVASLLLLASCVGGFSLGGSSPASAGPRPSSPSAEATQATSTSGSQRDKFAVVGFKVGMPLEGHKGFVCNATPAERYYLDRQCVKFLDPRCAGKPAKIGSKKYSETPPAGCFMDQSNYATYLDGTLMTPPLLGVHLGGTQSVPSKIFQIRYTFAADDLTDDSKLGAALIAKYGEPSDRNPPIEMKWKLGSPDLLAACRMTGGQTAQERNKGEYCTITVLDEELERFEREQQELKDSQDRRSKAPAPPPL